MFWRSIDWTTFEVLQGMSIAFQPLLFLEFDQLGSSSYIIPSLSSTRNKPPTKKKRLPEYRQTYTNSQLPVSAILFPCVLRETCATPKRLTRRTPDQKSEWVHFWTHLSSWLRMPGLKLMRKLFMIIWPHRFMRSHFLVRITAEVESRKNKAEKEQFDPKFGRSGKWVACKDPKSWKNWDWFDPC